MYLDGEEGMKFHERCLRCGDCGMGLRNGYFEVGDGVYCERDAWRRMRDEQVRGRGKSREGDGDGDGMLKVGRSPMGRMEKRSTRLMMMG